ncbi:MAG: 50S ribosomal protein L4 [Candidatus Aenigmatarchaeota archaeon]
MAKVYDLNGNVLEEIELPNIFNTPYRPDIIRRAVLAIQSARRQPYGTDPLAGKRSSAHYHGKRRYRFTMMNREMARMPRIHGKHAFYYAYRARVAPQTVKGRRAHPPKSEKIWLQSINKKENKLAIKSALASSSNIDIVKLHGHKVDESPIIFVDEFENIKKTKLVKNLLKKVIPKEIERCEKKKVRSGKGKMRGRKYKKKKGPLIITSKNCELLKSAKKIPGIDVTTIDNLNAELLAPGTHAGRFLIFTKSALKKLIEKFGE